MPAVMSEPNRPRQIIEAAITGSLGTVTEEGKPFVTMVTLAAMSPSRIVLLLSDLARHTRNLNQRPDCSLLLINRGSGQGDPLMGARLTLSGVVSRVARGESAELRATFLERHPPASVYVDFPDFNFYQFVVDEAHLVAGFGRIETFPASRL